MSRMPNIKSKAAPKRQQTHLPEATHSGCCRRPGSQTSTGLREQKGFCMVHVSATAQKGQSVFQWEPGERKLQLIRRKVGGRGEGICGRAKTFVNKLHCNVADERATPGERDPAPRHKSGAAPAKSRKSRWHKREKNHPLLLLNNSPGAPNTIPPSYMGAVHLGGSTAERLRRWSSQAPKCQTQPGFGK